MIIGEYQNQTGKTNRYPKDKMLECLTLGLCSEAGEIAGKIKKFHRGDYHRGDAMDNSLKLLLLSEIGDCLWYLSELATFLQFPLGDIMDHNIYKLQKRSENNTINGSGDNR